VVTETDGYPDAMPDTGPASEFGGAVKSRVGIQPTPPHVLTADERLRLIYLTGQDTELLPPDDGLSFNGLIPEEIQRELRKAEGVLEKGQYSVFDEA
jgi:hypothetical protein